MWDIYYKEDLNLTDIDLAKIRIHNNQLYLLSGKYGIIRLRIFEPSSMTYGT